MIPSKRKRQNDERGSSEQDPSDSENDILNALSGKRHAHHEVNSDDDFDTFLMGSIAKRDVKIGTGVVKNAKKNRVKGEIGGGSFQSMGQYSVSLPFGILYLKRVL